jgi:hypothetical protein
VPERSRCRRRRNSVEGASGGSSEAKAPQSGGSAQRRLRRGTKPVPKRSGAGTERCRSEAGAGASDQFQKAAKRQPLSLPSQGGAARGTSGATGDERTAPRRDGSGEGTKPVPERSGAGSEEDGRTRKRTGRPVVSPLPSVREGRRPVSMASNLSAS